MAWLDIKFKSDRRTYAVIEFILYFCAHLLGLSVRWKVRNGRGVRVVEVGADRTVYHIGNLGAEIDKCLESARTEIDVCEYRQVYVC